MAGAERRHRKRLAETPRLRSGVLPVAALFGGNASGKSNLVRALAFCRTFLLDGTVPGGDIPVTPFVLDPETAREPSRFDFLLLIEDELYEFRFTLTRSEVLEERLERYVTSRPRLLYQREGERMRFGASVPRKRLHQLVHRTTRPNELFQTKAVRQNLDLFRPVHRWFRDLLVLEPASRLGWTSPQKTASGAGRSPPDRPVRRRSGHRTLVLLGPPRPGRPGCPQGPARREQQPSGCPQADEATAPEGATPIQGRGLAGRGSQQLAGKDLAALASWAGSDERRGLALGNPNFEFWLLLHFEDGTGIGSALACRDRLRGHIPGYKKRIRPGQVSVQAVREAVGRAEKRDQPRCRDWPRAPGQTTVYRLAKRFIATD